MTEQSNAPKGPVTWVTTREDLMYLVEALRNGVVAVMDHETTGLDEHAVTGGASNGGVAARVALTSITVPQKNADGDWDGEEPTTYIVPLSHPLSPWLGQWRKVLRLIARAINTYSVPFVNHHAKFDARWTLATTGIDIAPAILWDTQSVAFILDETEKTALKETVPRIFGVPRWDDHDLSTPGAAERVDYWELGEYAARDTYWTWRLYHHQVAQLFLTGDPFDTPIGPEEVQDARLGLVAKYVSNPTARCLGMIEQRGIILDTAMVKKNLAEQEERASQGLDWLAETYGLDRGTASTAATSNWFKSLAQLGMDAGELRVMSMTASGNAQWDKHVLGKQARQGSKLAEAILAQRDAEKQATFMRSWLAKVSPAGAIHSTYRAAQVVTGRLSSADPNMQQISKKLRPAFIPRPGYYMADLDYSQLELRVAAFISRCAPMIQAYHEGQDLHRMFARDLLTRQARERDPGAPEVALEDVSAEWRQRAKAGNFGFLYMQQAEGFRGYADKSYGVELTEEEAHAIRQGFFTTWDGMEDWHKRQVQEAVRNGYVTSPIGRVRRLPGIYDTSSFTRGQAERQAVNAVVQGFGSDLMQMAIASIYGQLPGSTPVRGAHPVGTVHDSLVAEVEIDRWEETVAECQERMTNLDTWLRRMGCELDVPLAADATVGTRWSYSDIQGE